MDNGTTAAKLTGVEVSGIGGCFLPKTEGAVPWRLFSDWDLTFAVSAFLTVSINRLPACPFSVFPMSAWTPSPPRNSLDLSRSSSASDCRRDVLVLS